MCSLSTSFANIKNAYSSNSESSLIFPKQPHHRRLFIPLQLYRNALTSLFRLYNSKEWFVWIIWNYNNKWRINLWPMLNCYKRPPLAVLGRTKRAEIFSVAAGNAISPILLFIRISKPSMIAYSRRARRRREWTWLPRRPRNFKRRRPSISITSSGKIWKY